MRLGYVRPELRKVIGQRDMTLPADLDEIFLMCVDSGLPINSYKKNQVLYKPHAGHVPEGYVSGYDQGVLK
ncbi:hypothetical protein JW968_06285 [Candidatus Woesearchaeota archaeon]|nr:hypothetical protein [Candidatus Woesearchaeota archaeon]